MSAESGESAESTLIVGPVAWGGVWGHGPELARFLALKRPVEYLDPLEPPGPAAPSFHGGDSWPRPAGLTVTRRRSRLRPGLLYGLEMEWKNFQAARRSRARHLVTYYPLGSILALTWFRLRGKRSLLIYADFPDILRHPLARFLARAVGLRLSAGLATAGSLATSRLLFEDLGRFTVRRQRVPNGVCLTDIPAELRQGVPREPGTPFTVGFVGFFGEWIDLETVLDTARRLPEVRFVLVGEGVARERLAGREKEVPNVVFTGRLPRDMAFREIARMDLGLVPFHVNAVTDRVSPVKLFEYWALGLPAAATACRELKALADAEPEVLFLYSGAPELESHIRSLRGDPERLSRASARARRAAARYDWNVLGAEIENLLFHGTKPTSNTQHSL